MKFPSPWIGFLTVAIVIGVAPNAVRAQVDPLVQALNDKQMSVLKLRWQSLELDAMHEVLEDEKNLQRAAELAEPSRKALTVEPEILLKKEWSQTNTKRNTAIDEALNRARAEKKSCKSDWDKVNAAHLLFEARKSRTMSELAAVRAEHLWDRSTTWIVVWGVCLIGASVALGLHGRRRQIRSGSRFSGKMGAAGVAAACLLAAPLASVSLADHQAEVERELAALERECETKDEKNRDLKRDADKARDDRLQQIRGLYPEGFPSDFIASEQKASEAMREILCTEALRKAAAEDGKIKHSMIETGQKDIEASEKKLADIKAAERVHLRWNGGIKIGLCAVFMALAFVPYRRMENSRIREQKKQADQCPCCLATGSLEKKTSAVQDKRYPELTYVKCAECGYELRSSYQKLPRLCFPTVGVPGSGKTHWLVTAYELIKNDKVPVSAALQSAPSITDKDFDIQIEEIIENHKKARGTLHNPSVFPYPLVFQIKECENYLGRMIGKFFPTIRARMDERNLLGKHRAMLNLFDFSGEMMRQNVNTDVLRQRALLMDGFVLFLDPTKVKINKGGDSLKNQIQALASFHQEIRDMRGVDVGTPVPVPIAVCISKLDLISTQSPLSQAAIPWINALRESFARPLTLAELHTRSKLCEQVLANLFPGWNLTRTLDEHFGGRFQFFPLTPVGIEEGTLGQGNFARTQFSPVGVLEPILWLLHMHGFNIFD